jgi:hypothetical protein
LPQNAPPTCTGTPLDSGSDFVQPYGVPFPISGQQHYQLRLTSASHVSIMPA